MDSRLLAASVLIAVTTTCRAPRSTEVQSTATVTYVAGQSTPTILVTNATCSLGPCVPFQVGGFIPKFTVPGQPPSGFALLGTVDSASACLRFPAEVILTVGTDTTIWTTSDPIILTAAKSPPEVLGQTPEFQPAAASAWTVTMPGVVSAATKAAATCGP